MRRLLALGGVLTFGLAAAALARLPFANGPAEWEWAWREGGLDGGWWWLLGALVAAAFLVGVGWAAAAGRLSARVALPLLVLCGWLFTLAVAGVPDGFERVAAALASRHSFGYLWDAALAPPAWELLADYPRASRRLNQHARTHPPGALLAVRGVDVLARRLPAGGGDLFAAAREALERERQRASARRRPVPSSLPSPWTVLLLAALLPALSALAALPLHALALRLGLPPPTALLAGALWALVPARSLFTPSLDQALPLLLLGAAALAVGEGWVRKGVAGALLALACFISYGALAVVPLVALAAWIADKQPRALLALAAGFAVPWLLLVLFAGYDPWTSFAAAMRAHRAIAVAPRGYLTWLLWNPYDFALLLGPAVALPALGALALRGRLRAAAAVLWGTLALLLLSGGVRGEVGRIWLPFMPWACLLAAAVLTRREAPALLALQALLACVLAAVMVFVA